MVRFKVPLTILHRLPVFGHHSLNFDGDLDGRRRSFGYACYRYVDRPGGWSQCQINVPFRGTEVQIYVYVVHKATLGRLGLNGLASTQQIADNDAC